MCIRVRVDVFACVCECVRARAFVGPRVHACVALAGTVSPTCGCVRKSRACPSQERINRDSYVRVFALGKDKELRDKEARMLELQEVYETVLLKLNVSEKYCRVASRER